MVACLLFFCFKFFNALLFLACCYQRLLLMLLTLLKVHSLNVYHFCAMYTLSIVKT